MKICNIASLALLLIVPAMATAQPAALEIGLLQSMSINTNSDGTIERAQSSGEAIQAYMKDGYISKRPNLRYDYTDHYLLNKPASLLGHDLKVIEEEYMTQYAGCCVSEGVGAVIKQNGNLNILKIFAEENKCSITPVDFNEYLKDFGINNAKVPRGAYYSLSCRERELNTN